MSPFHEAARAAIARGWRVFPLKARDKIPATAHGCKDASSHVGQIEAWWRGKPDCNVGLATGPESGVFALDVDGDDGAASLAALETAHGALPPTLTQSTGKGRHLLFRWPNGAADVRNSARKLGAGLDVRGRGGYIVIAPSVHPSGRVYAWTSAPDDTPIANAPAWLLDLVAPAVKKAEAPKPYQPAQRKGRATLYGEKALDSACRRIAGAQPGSQNTILTSEAAAIGELVAGGEIERAYAERALISAALQMVASKKPWLPDEIAKKVAWGFQVGAASPRAVSRARDLSPSRPAPPRPVEQEGARTQTRVETRDPGIDALLIAPPDDCATLIVAPRDIAEEAALAWEGSNGGAYGLFAPADLFALAGGLAPNSGGFDDWRLPRADFNRPALTRRWKGRVLVVLPPDLQGFTVSKGTKWERFISPERHTQVLGLLAAHWWRHAGASDVQIAVLPQDAKQEESAA